MNEKRGSADLPLHGGSCPKWLFGKMKKLGGQITEVIVKDYGQEELLDRLSNPYFFQSLGCALGFDWHSSGITTTVCGALKEGVNERNIGVKICGGKGKTSRRTPNEIEETNFNLSTQGIESLKKFSKLSATVDNSLLQDNFQIYHHCFILTEGGNWSVIQQGMNGKEGMARRYHWKSRKDFLNDPQEAICSEKRKGNCLNLSSSESKRSRKISLELVNDNPEHLKKYFNDPQKRITEYTSNGKELKMPSKHELEKIDLTERGFKSLKKAYEIQPENYEELVSVKGLGKKSLRALALISELIYGSESDWRDPAKYSFAHGGKDGHPYPVNEDRYEESINFLQRTLEETEIGNKEKRKSMKKLGQMNK